MQQRIPFIDNLKAVAMLMVVFNHTLSGGAASNFIASINMPLFLFISGILYKPRVQYAKHMAKALLWPYIVFALLSFAYWALFEIRFRTFNEGISLSEQFFDMFYLKQASETALLMNSPLWFLPALFICSCTYNYTLANLRAKHKVAFELCFVITFVLLLHFFPFNLPFFIPQALHALPFYIFGVICKDAVIQLNTSTTGWRKSLFYIILVAVAILIWMNPSCGRMFRNEYDLGYLRYFVAGTVMSIVACMSMPNRPLKIGNLIGANTLGILVLHDPIKRIIIYVYSWLSGIEIAMVRSSAIHSIFIVFLVIAIVCPIVILIKKYCPWLFKMPSFKISSSGNK